MARLYAAVTRVLRTGDLDELHTDLTDLLTHPPPPPPTTPDRRTHTMTPLDTLKAGVKTAVVAFIVILVAVLTSAVGELVGWLNSSGADTIDLSGPQAVLFSGLAALAIGLLNTILRYVQVVAVPLLSQVVDKLLGAVPAYPEAHVEKIVDTADVNVIRPAP